MRTDILNPQGLFQNNVRYTIPAFQRPYVWDKDGQWDLLWNDIRNVAEEYLEELERSGNDYVKAEQQTKPHFLGAIVLQQIPTATRDIQQREVIDGQQRVTTLQLLLDAIQEVCEELGLKQTATYLSKLVANDKDLVRNESHHIFKLWPSSIGNDREAFRHAMDNGLDVDDFEGSRIVEAHEFFKDQARSWLNPEGMEGSIGNRAEALATSVTARLQMVVIDLDLSVDPHLIFETLNARGTPLAESELIKNYVLSGADSSIDVWGDLDDPWWYEEVSQGRLNRRRLDMLLNHWLAMKTGEEVSPSQVFNRFRDYSRNLQIESVMQDVRRDLANYRSFQTKNLRTKQEEQFYYRTDVMQVGVITPVLLLLLSAEHDVRIRAFGALESFLVRRMICRQTTKDYNRMILDLAVRLQNGDPAKADKIVAHYLKDQTANSREWPSNETVAISLVSLPLYRLLTRGRLRLVLEGIESQRLLSKMAEHDKVPKGLTIEHIMPVSWGKNWDLPKCEDTDQASQYRNGLIHTIGNLTLVNQKLNTELSNSAWGTKKDALRKHSVMNMNSELTDYPVWDEQTIVCRSREMARLIAEHWPGPDSPRWG